MGIEKPKRTNERTADIAAQASAKIVKLPRAVEAIAVAEAAAAANDPHDIDPPSLDVYGADVCNGRPLATLPALKALLRHFDIEVRRNLMTREQEYTFRGRQIAAAEVRSVCRKAQMPTSDLPNYLPHIGRANGYHPVGEWIRSARWDGVDRFPALLRTIGHVPDTIQGVMVRRWMRGAAALACLPEPALGEALPCKMQGVLVLQGKQGCGKTRWLTALAHHAAWYIDGSTLRPDNTDSVRQNTTRWINELGEVESTIAGSQSLLKAWLTKDRDVYRIPYASDDETHHRRTAFCGSTNLLAVLQDPTGNRRWWIARVDACDVDALASMPLQQVWAQAWHEWESDRSGTAHCLTRAEEAEVERINAEVHREQTPAEQALLAKYDPGLSERPLRMSAREVAEACGYVGGSPEAAARQMAVALRIHFGNAVSDGGRQVYRLPRVRHGT